MSPDLAARLHDPTVVLPFANLQTADKVRKAHGITGALLAEEEPAPVTDAQRRAASDPRSRQGRADPTGATGVLRSRTALRSGSPSRPAAARPRATPVPRTTASATSGKAPKAPTRLSAEGVLALEAELLELTTVTRPAIVARIVSARELGDLKENSDYQEARREQSFAEGRIRAIEDLLRHVELIEEGVEGGRARLGSTLLVEGPHGEEETFSLVGPTEANPAAGRISSSSPIGAALLGAAAGDEVEAIVPSGRLRFRILEVR